MGPSRVLHLMNPLRHDFIASCLAEGPPQQDQPSEPDAEAGARTKVDLHYLDVGCGGGIFAESLARTIGSGSEKAMTPTRAASITAIDPSSTLIQIARDHARTDPTIDAHLRTGRFSYQNRTLEDLVQNQPQPQDPRQELDHHQKAQKQGYDVVTLFEVLEHIDPTTTTPLTFLTNCLRLVKPGGWLIGSTIARSLPSFLINQVIAEAPWPIGVVPRGTHEWGKFVNPDEVKTWVVEGLRDASGAGDAGAGKSVGAEGMMWACEGVMYFPGLGWRMVNGSEDWGNYFWGVRRGF